MGPKCHLLLAGTCPTNPSNVEHLVNSFADLRQEIDSPLSLPHALVGSVESKVCGAEESIFSTSREATGLLHILLQGEL